jgi:catechol 2,3-dioxygenase-like lactoylglutathione lyase family enzyme
MAITGVHVILYTDDAAADRAFFADVLGLTSVDAGDGWLIFALPRRSWPRTRRRRMAAAMSSI